MAKENVTILGLPQLKAALLEKVDELRKASQMAVADEVQKVRDDAVKFAPRHTGNLEDGINADAAGLKGTVRSTSRHSMFVEHGTYKDRAQPFMTPAAERARKRFPATATAIIRSVLEGK